MIRLGTVDLSGFQQVPMNWGKMLISKLIIISQWNELSFQPNVVWLYARYSRCLSFSPANQQKECSLGLRPSSSSICLIVFRPDWLYLCFSCPFWHDFRKTSLQKKILHFLIHRGKLVVVVSSPTAKKHSFSMFPGIHFSFCQTLCF